MTYWPIGTVVHGSPLLCCRREWTHSGTYTSDAPSLSSVIYHQLVTALSALPILSVSVSVDTTAMFLSNVAPARVAR